MHDTLTGQFPELAAPAPGAQLLAVVLFQQREAGFVHPPLMVDSNARMDAAVYHQRWMSETGFSLLKQDDGEKLRSRSWHGQFRELTRKCIMHNLSQAAS